MKIVMMIALLGLAALAQSKNGSALPAGVPAGAVAVEEYAWRWTDEQGKAWLFRLTPVGLVRVADLKPSEKRPAEVPADAVPVSDHLWRWVDPQQKAWLFRASPAGWVKSEEPKNMPVAKGTKDAKDAKEADGWLDLFSAKEEGESIRFTRASPFGKSTWVKRKTQLDSDETAVWNRTQAKTAAAKKD